MQPTEPPKYLTPEEVAQRIRVTKRTVYDYLAPGGVLFNVAVRVSPRVVLVSEEDLNQWLNERRGTM